MAPPFAKSGRKGGPPARDRSTEKIDGIVALVMALGRAIRQPGMQESVYERRDLVTV